MKLDFCDIRGLPIYLTSRFPKENFEAAMDYRARDGDVVVATYPKTGTTWLQYIAWQILHRAQSYPSFDDAMFREMPYMEIAGVDVVDQLLPPRLYKTHLPYNHINVNPKAKYLYVHRNPGDTLVSYFYFWNDMIDLSFQKPVDRDSFFDMFLTGQISYGDYFDHVLSFYSHKDDGNILFLSYEELKSNSREQILKIAKFLGDEFYQSLSEDSALLHKVLKVTSFEYMKEHLHLSRISFGPPGEESKDAIESDQSNQKRNPPNFFRKGIVGDSNSVLTEEHKMRLLDKISAKMVNTDLLDAWQCSISL